MQGLQVGQGYLKLFEGNRGLYNGLSLYMDRTPLIPGSPVKASQAAGMQRHGQVDYLRAIHCGGATT